MMRRVIGMKLICVKDTGEMSQRACDMLAEEIDRLEAPVLGLATGSTPEGLYRCMAGEFKNGNLSLRKATSFNLDEYVGIGSDDPNSYRYYMEEKLFRHVDIMRDRTNVPNGIAAILEEECFAYEKRIKEAGGIDLQVLGLGQNGHIGFNEPGTSFLSRTHIVDLALSTRKANARFFTSFEDVPKQAITMGISTIMESRMILLLVSGKEKDPAVKRLFEGKISENFPASVLKEHPNVIVIADEDALGGFNPDLVE